MWFRYGSWESTGSSAASCQLYPWSLAKAPFILWNSRYLRAFYNLRRNVWFPPTSHLMYRLRHPQKSCLALSWKGVMNASVFNTRLISISVFRNLLFQVQSKNSRIALHQRLERIKGYLGSEWSSTTQKSTGTATKSYGRHAASLWQFTYSTVEMSSAA